MNLAVIGFSNLISMPYMRFYKSLFEKNQIHADYYWWNRDKAGSVYISEGNVYNINIKCKDNRFNKFFSMLKWRKTITALLKKKHYDKIIILTSLPAIFLYRFLIRNFSGRYIFDIRDYSYEHNRIYQQFMQNLCDKSYVTFVSSPGFRSMLLSDFEVKNIHNIDVKEADYSAPSFNKKEVILGYAGLIKYYESNVELIENCSDRNYKFYYYGIFEDKRWGELFEKDLNNVKFFGRFLSEQKNDIYKNIDIVNCYFAKNLSYGQRLLLPNRLYDALYCNRPILVNEGCFLADYVKHYGIGLVINDGRDISKQIEKYIDSFDKNVFEKNVKICLANIEKEQITAERTILNFIKTDKNALKG